MAGSDRWAAERALLRLAIPIAGGMIVETGYGVVDTVLIGRVHPTALAAVGFGRLAMAPVILFLGALLYGVQAVAGRHAGAGDVRAAGTTGREALRVALWAGVVLGAVATVCVPWLCDAVLRDSGVALHATGYLQVRTLGVVVIAAGLAMRGFLYAVGRPGIDLAVSSGALALNAVLSLWWIHGGAGVPALGVTGAALGSLVSEAVYTIAIAWVLGFGSEFAPYAWRRRGSDGAERRRVVRLSLPRGVQGLALAAFPAFLVIMEKIGVVPAAAAQVVLNAASVFFFVGFGIGVAGGTQVAQALGRQDPAGARRVAAATARVVLVVCGSLALLCALLSVPIIALSTDDPLVREAALGPLLAYCAFLVLDAFGAAFAKLLVAAGVARYVMVVEIVAGLGIFMPVSYVAGVVWGGGAWAVWAGFGCYILVFCTSVTLKIRGRAWTSVKI